MRVAAQGGYGKASVAAVMPKTPGCTVDIWYVSLRVGGSTDLVLDIERPMSLPSASALEFLEFRGVSRSYITGAKFDGRSSIIGVSPSE